MEYLAIEIILFLIVFLIHRRYKVKIFKSKKQFIVFWLIVLIGGGIWDNYSFNIKVSKCPPFPMCPLSPIINDKYFYHIIPIQQFPVVYLLHHKQPC